MDIRDVRCGIDLRSHVSCYHPFPPSSETARFQRSFFVVTTQDEHLCPELNVYGTSLNHKFEIPLPIIFTFFYLVCESHSLGLCDVLPQREISESRASMAVEMDAR